MTWIGDWRNQYGSLVRITGEAEGRIEGVFATVLEDSGFFGQEAPIVGVCRGRCISFAATGRGPAGDMVVSYTGLLREGRMETLWYYAADTALGAARPGEPAEAREVPWWKAVIANADTFERVGPADGGGPPGV